MARVRFGDVVKEVKINIDRKTDDHEFFIAGEHMESENIHITKKGRFANSDVGPAFIRLFKPGQVLYGSRRTYLKKVAVADFEGITSNTTFVLETKDPKIMLQELLPFIMLTDSFTAYAVKNSKGSTNPYILFSDLAAYEFELPDIEEQKRLVTKLLACDRVKEAYKKQIQATEDLVKSQFIEMFADEAKRVRLDELCLHFGDGDWIESKDQSEEGIRLLQTGNVGNGEYKDKDDKARYISEETFIRLGCTEVFPGDILISRLPDPIGRACIVPEMPKSITAVDCTIVRLKADVLSTFFVNFTKTPIYTMQIDSFTTGSTRKRISRANLGSVMVPVPDLARQERFVSIAEQSDKSKFELQEAIVRIDNLIKSLIQQDTE